LPHERTPAEWDAVLARARVRASCRPILGRRPLDPARRFAAGVPGLGFTHPDPTTTVPVLGATGLLRTTFGGTGFGAAGLVRAVLGAAGLVRAVLGAAGLLCAAVDAARLLR
jgi:hypothetical protein